MKVGHYQEGKREGEFWKGNPSLSVHLKNILLRPCPELGSSDHPFMQLAYLIHFIAFEILSSRPVESQARRAVCVHVSWLSHSFVPCRKGLIARKAEA